MKIVCFDQYEFQHFEGEEYLALASQDKNLRGTLAKNFKSFYNLTEKYDAFEFWQDTNFADSQTKKVRDIEGFSSLSESCERLCDIRFVREQEILVLHEDWNLKDVLWEKDNTFYRALWCTTA